MRQKAILFLLAFLLQMAAIAGASASVLPFAAYPLSFSLQDSLAVDSSTVVADSLKNAQPKKEAIEAPVYYESTDSMVWSMNGNAFLYGSGKVVYDKIELTADIISMNMDSSIVHAYGRADSLGVVTGLPVFVDNGTQTKFTLSTE